MAQTTRSISTYPIGRRTYGGGGNLPSNPTFRTITLTGAAGDRSVVLDAAQVGHAPFFKDALQVGGPVVFGGFSFSGEPPEMMLATFQDFTGGYGSVFLSNPGLAGQTGNLWVGNIDTLGGHNPELGGNIRASNIESLANVFAADRYYLTAGSSAYAVASLDDTEAPTEMEIGSAALAVAVQSHGGLTLISDTQIQLSAEETVRIISGNPTDGFTWLNVGFDQVDVMRFDESGQVPGGALFQVDGSYYIASANDANALRMARSVDDPQAFEFNAAQRSDGYVWAPLFYANATPNNGGYLVRNEDTGDIFDALYLSDDSAITLGGSGGPDVVNIESLGQLILHPGVGLPLEVDAYEGVILATHEASDFGLYVGTNSPIDTPPPGSTTIYQEQTGELWIKLSGDWTQVQTVP